jgi:nucleotide-binding universal stress UspA family protein
MNELDRLKTDAAARRRIGEPRRARGYSDAVNRYLGAANYRDLNLSLMPPGVPARQAAAAPRSAEPRTRRTRGVVLVGVDDTPASYIAVDHAAIEAEIRGCDMHLLHVQHPQVNRSDARDRGAQLLERMTERIHGCSPAVAVTARLATGSATATLLSESRNADLVVVGHRHGPVGTAFGRTVGEYIAAHHEGPVLVVRVPGWPPGPDFATRPIAVAVDDSPAAKAAIDFALAEARLRECDVIMLDARYARRHSGGRMERSGDIVIHHRVAGSDPVTAFLAASGHAAALVVGRRGGGGLAGRPLGSISHTMIQRADCPVFVLG